MLHFQYSTFVFAENNSFLTDLCLIKKLRLVRIPDPVHIPYRI